MPRLGVRFDPEERSRLEHATLAAIHGHFTGLGDPRFGTIRPLDTLDDHLAMIMERATGVSLRDILVRSGLTRVRAGRPDPSSGLANAGAWLAHYHRQLETGHAATRRATRDEFLASVRNLTEYLGLARDRPFFFGRLAGSIGKLAGEVLPPSFPLGLGHGDFAPRNVLVEPSGRVTILDTLGRWRIPIYEDLAYFLVGVKSLGVQVVSMGRALGPQRVGDWEGAFLQGYFGQDGPPIAPIRLFEIESILARWASAAHRWRQARGVGRVRRRVELMLKDRFFGRLVSTLLSDPALGNGLPTRASARLS